MGIGGVGMCALAEVLHARGFEVSGCDLAASERTERLQNLGIYVYVGHDPDHLDGVDALVYSAAVDPDDAEVETARRQGLTVLRRAEMLAELMHDGRGVAVAGTHGKTTTTAMIGHLLNEAGLDPTVLVGGHARFADSHARIGGGDLLVCEADEYDRSFLELHPTVSVVTNLEPEHLDCYGSEDELKQAFTAFSNQTSVLGRVVVCRDDEGSWDVAEKVDRPLTGYGFSEGATLRAVDVRCGPDGSRFAVLLDGAPLGEASIRLPGRFNVLNALAALAVGLELGVAFDVLAAACATFTGVERRFDVLGSRNDVTVVDDYAHHPTELDAALEAARQALPDRRIVVVFQPHLYSRTRDFADRFAASLLAADVVVVLPIYPAREQPLEGVDEHLVVNAARRLDHPSISAGPPVDLAPAYVDKLLLPGDVLMTMGAGDVHRVAEAWLEGAA
jgi:UDP-N-acetylmuramate--alanine ligase